MRRCRRFIRRAFWHALLVLPGIIMRFWRCEHAGFGLCFSACCDCLGGCPAFEDDLSGGFDSEVWESIGSLRILHEEMCVDEMRVTVSVVDGGKAVLQYNAETGEYLWAQWSSGVLSLGYYDTVAESEAELTSCEVDDPPDGRLTLCLSWINGSLKANAGDVFAFANGVDPTGGLRAGVSSSGSPENFSLGVTALDGSCLPCSGVDWCVAGSCQSCDPPFQPNIWMVSMPPLDNDDCAAGNCDNFEGEWILSNFSSPWWFTTITPSICGRNYFISMSRPCHLSGPRTVVIMLGNGPQPRYELVQEHGIDCTLPMEGFVWNGNAINDDCDWSSAVGITAAPVA